MTANVNQFVPPEVIVQVAQDLDTIFITGAHSASFLLHGEWRNVKAVAIYRNTSSGKIFPQLREARPDLLTPSLFTRRPKSVVIRLLPISCSGFPAPLVGLFSDRGANDMVESKSRSLERALARRDITVPTGHSRTLAIS